MGESGENHGDGVIRRERELGLSDIRFKLIDDGGEDGIRKPVKRSPLGVAERSFHSPDMFSGKSSKSGDGEFGGGGGRGRGGGRGFIRGGGFRGFVVFVGGFGWGVGGDVGEDGGDGEEEEGSGGGGGEEGGWGGGVGGGGSEVGEEGGGGVQVVVKVE